MYILSIYGGHDASICLLKNGKIAVHLELERITRKKSQAGYRLDEPVGDSPCPWRHSGLSWFIDLALADQGISWDDISCVALLSDGIDLNRDDRFVPGSKPVYIVNHHEAHAASAFYVSPFTEAMVLTLDGGGNDGGGLIGFGQGRTITIRRKVRNGAFGIFWDLAMQFWSKSRQGPISTEGVLMGAAAYGQPWPPLQDFFLDRIRALAAIDSSSIGIEVEAALTELAHRGSRDGLLPPDFSPDNEKDYFTFCASLQKATELIIDEYISELVEAHDCRNLCLAGGVTLNCNALGKALLGRPELRAFSCPTPGDAGLTIGAALFVYHSILGHERTVPLEPASPYLGLTHSTVEIEALLAATPGISVEQTRSTDRLAALLLDKAILGLYCGRSESGRRALGNRSIVADPRDPAIRERINRTVKHRQWYRPFAPSVLHEHTADIFERNVDSPYMSLAIPVRVAWRDRLPAVVHADGTARLQTVTRQSNPFYYDLIASFHRRTQIPMLLNTSFNDNEPIVETPEDALRCFLNTDIDYLYIGGFLVSKIAKNLG